jgi:hypothetical protein
MAALALMVMVDVPDNNNVAPVSTVTSVPVPFEIVKALLVISKEPPV